jgi:hypothetical protein
MHKDGNAAQFIDILAKLYANNTKKNCFEEFHNHFGEEIALTLWPKANFWN